MNPDPTNTKRAFTAAAMLIAAASFLVSNFMREPSLDGPGSTVVGLVSANLSGLRSGTWANIVYVIATTLFLLGLVTLIRGRGSVAVFAGAAIALVGNLAHSAVVVVQVVAANLPAVDPVQMAGLWDRFNNDPLVLPLVAMIFLFPVGTTLLTFGLVRAGLLHWSLLVLGIGLGVIDFAHFPYSHDLLAIGNAVVSVAVSAALLAPKINRRVQAVAAPAA
jgi:hypothetical protein